MCVGIAVCTTFHLYFVFMLRRIVSFKGQYGLYNKTRYFDTKNRFNVKNKFLHEQNLLLSINNHKISEKSHNYGKFHKYNFTTLDGAIIFFDENKNILVE